MKTFRTVLATVVVSSAVIQASGLTLEEVLRGGLEGGLSRKSRELTRELGRTRIDQARTAYFPTLRGNTGTTHNWKKPIVEGAPQGERWSAEAGLNLAQTLYSAAAITGLKIARHGAVVDSLANQVQRETLLVELATLYWTIVWLEDNRASLLSSRSQLDRLAGTVQSMVDNGVERRSELNSARLAVWNVEASIEGIDQQIAAQKNALLVAMGREPDSTIRLADSLGSPISLDSARDSGSTSSLRWLHEQIRAKELEEELATDARLPVVRAFVRYGTQGGSDRFDLVGKARERFSANGALGIELEVPIFDGGSANAAGSIARLERRQLELETLRRELASRAEVSNARRNLAMAIRQVERQSATNRLARETFLTKEDEYRQQVASLADLLRAESEVLAARSNLSEAICKERLAKLEMDRVLGRLASRAR